MSQQFGVGSILGTTFRVYLRNFIPFTLIAGLLYIPMIIFTGWFLSSDFSISSLLKYAGISAVLSLVLNSFVSATLTYGVVKELQGQRAGIGACIKTGFSRLLPVLGVALLCGLAIVGGMILLIVPGIIAACVLYVAMPASVIEKPGVFGALRRSSDLTRGYRGAMFGLLLIVGVINWLIGKVEQTAFDMSTLANIKTYMYVNCASSIVMGAFTSVLAAVAYYSLRVEKDGTTVDELAAVFS